MLELGLGPGYAIGTPSYLSKTSQHTTHLLSIIYFKKLVYQINVRNHAIPLRRNVCIVKAFVLKYI